MSASVHEATAPKGPRCPVCAAGFTSGAATACPRCHTVHHADCWWYNHGCAIFGCAVRPGEAQAKPAGIPAGPAPRPPVARHVEAARWAAVGAAVYAVLLALVAPRRPAECPIEPRCPMVIVEELVADPLVVHRRFGGRHPLECRVPAPHAGGPRLVEQVVVDRMVLDDGRIDRAGAAWLVEAAEIDL